jgi:predicted alpha/beta-fold hydrolase
VRRLLDVWGFVPPPARPHEIVHLRTRDGAALAATYFPGPAQDRPGRAVPAVVLAHGFAGHRHKPAYALLAEVLSERMAVLAVDLRGHGDSRGRSTLGDREALDVRAAASWLRCQGHLWVAGIGVSMGGTAVLRAAGSGSNSMLDAVCAVSAPAEFIRVGSPQVEALVRTMTSTTWRLVAETVLRVRIARGWGHPTAAVELVGAIAPVPLLVVHGEDDHFFGPEHAERLYRAAGEPRTLWREPAGFGHAEDGLGVAFDRRLADAVMTVNRTGRWPGGVESRARTA